MTPHPMTLTDSEVLDMAALSAGGHGGHGGPGGPASSRPARTHTGFILKRFAGANGIPVSAWFEGHLYWQGRTDGRPVITVSLCQNGQGAFLFGQLAPARAMCALLNAHDEHNADEHRARWVVVNACDRAIGGIQ